jgi:hypothetical protein
MCRKQDAQQAELSRKGTLDGQVLSPAASFPTEIHPNPSPDISDDPFGGIDDGPDSHPTPRA